MSSDPEFSRDELLEVLSAIPDFIMVIARDLNVEFVNRSGEEGYRREEIENVSITTYITPESREPFREAVFGVFRTGEPTTFETRVVDASGETQWYEGSLRPIWRDGEVVRVVNVATNVTARHVAEEEATKLRTLVPICSWCGQIRDDEGYWSKVEAYVEHHTGSRVTHGMCPDCEGTMESNGTEGGV